MGSDAGKYDCIVIGGGPAGATAATVLADHGRRVLVLERHRFPRHHVGESLMPQSYATFKRIGMLEKLRASNSPVKESVQFVSASGRESQPFFFFDRDPAEWSRTWQVRRDEFDQMMLDNAADHGAEIRFGARVKSILFDGDRAVGVRAVVDGQEREIRATVVVDATGQSALLSRQLDLRYPDARLKKASIYSYFKGAIRDEGRNAGATIIIHTPDRNGWFWFIPLSDDTASVGVVASPSYLFSGRGDDPSATLQEEFEQCPAIMRRVEKASRVGNVFVTTDFSCQSRRITGDGWVLVGDAFGFLDPVYSSGVFLALVSGEWAADAIHDALDADDVSADRLGRFGPRFMAGMQLMRQMVYAFYDPRFSFATFLKSHPEHHDRLVRLLIGDVFNDEVGEIFDAMGEWVDFPDPIVMEQEQAGP